MFLYYTGCRIGAALKITWDMVSPHCTTMLLPATITKNKKPLPLALPAELTAMLRKKFRQGDVFDATNLRNHWEKAAPDVLIHAPPKRGAEPTPERGARDRHHGHRRLADEVRLGSPRRTVAPVLMVAPTGSLPRKVVLADFSSK